MKVQVFIPTFNRAQLLRRAVQSVLNQSFPDIEAVVLDNNSDDDTSTVVTALMQSDSRLKYVRHIENVGMIANFNCVRDLVSGDFFSILTDDDEYEDDFVATALACFAKNDSVQFVACNAPTLIDGKPLKSQLDHWREGFYPANTKNVLCVLGHYPLITNCMFRAAVRPDFYFNPAMGHTADGLLLTCLFAKYNGYVRKAVTGSWNVHQESASEKQKFNPVGLVDAASAELCAYREFCAENNIKMRALFLLKLKRAFTILAAADRSNFEFIRTRSLMRKDKRASVAVLRVLHAIRIVRLMTAVLSSLRRLNARRIARHQR